MTPAIEIRQACKTYGDLKAVNCVDLEVSQGEFFALLGPNGAGKTTLINLLSGLCRPDSGTLSIMGFDVSRNYKDARRSVGVVPQELVFDPFFTVREVLEVQSGYFGISDNSDWIDEILTRLDLIAKADINMRALSGGMKRRVLVAQALVHKPPVIILDEPTAGVDVELRQGLWEFVRSLNEAGHTIVLTTHYLEEAQSLCNRIAMLKAGKIVALDTTENLLKGFSMRRVKLQISPDAMPDELKSRCLGIESGYHVLKLDEFSELENMLEALRKVGTEVTDMILPSPDLEEVFVEIMSEA
jgi:ABC-2 type transport system ATP-binding protein